MSDRQLHPQPDHGSVLMGSRQEGVIVRATDGRILEVNRSFGRMSGLRREDAICGDSTGPDSEAALAALAGSSGGRDSSRFTVHG